MQTKRAEFNSTETSCLPSTHMNGGSVLVDHCHEHTGVRENRVLDSATPLHILELVRLVYSNEEGISLLRRHSVFVTDSKVKVKHRVLMISSPTSSNKCYPQKLSSYSSKSFCNPNHNSEI